MSSSPIGVARVIAAPAAVALRVRTGRFDAEELGNGTLRHPVEAPQRYESLRITRELSQETAPPCPHREPMGM